jgi:hypothetical protein
MGDFDHIGKAIDAISQALITLSIIAAITIPLAIWKLIDIIIWLMPK